jgi:hypothetical protein
MFVAGTLLENILPKDLMELDPMHPWLMLQSLSIPEKATDC